MVRNATHPRVQMIISDHLKFVFIHNPKCAGTAIRTALLSQDTTGHFFWMHDTCNGHRIDKAHLPLFVLRQRFPAYFERLAEYFTFMAVRNPFARAISAFNETHIDLYEAYRTGAAVSRYKDDLNRFFDELSDDSIAGWQFAFRHFVRQTDLCYLGDKSHVDVLLRCESLAADVTRVRFFNTRLADLLDGVKSQHRRPIDHSVTALLNHRSIRKIATLYERDFILLDYSPVP